MNDPVVTLRQSMRMRRQNLNLATQQAASQNLVRYLTAFPRLQQAKVIALYQPVAGEIDPRALQAVWPEKTWVFPTVTSVQEKTMHFFPLSSSAGLRSGAYGIPEPEPVGTPWDDRIDVVVTPLLAFDAQGHRLGAGGGYYDRFFQRIRAPWRVGVGYAFQQVAHVPVRAWDVPMHCVVTESGMVAPKADS